MEAPMLNIEAVKPETVQVVQDAIIAILSSGAEEKTLRVALRVLSNAAKGGTRVITNCSFTNTKPESYFGAMSPMERAEMLNTKSEY